METLKEITENIDLITVWLERGSGYGQYNICFDYRSNGEAKTIKLNFADSQIWDEYQDIEDSAMIEQFLIDRFSRKFDDSKEAAESYFFNNQEEA